MFRLGPHESPGTDVILLGHSLGGILCAEVALLAPYTGGSIRQFTHRILGTINFDTPFLGMHPGVIASGLGSLVRHGPDSPNARPSASGTATQDSTKEGVPSSNESASYFGLTATTSTTSLLTESSSTTNLAVTTPQALDTPIKDPNYDPPFPNDIRLPQRTGWNNAWHFINKHSDGLVRATKSYVTSHLEFGGCLADYNGLKARYARIRELEEGREGARVRFVNYYTASTGRPKKVKEAEGQRVGQFDGREASLGEELSQLSLSEGGKTPPSPSPSIIIEQAEGERGLDTDGNSLHRQQYSSHSKLADDEGPLTEGGQSVELEMLAPIKAEDGTQANTPSPFEAASTRNDSSDSPLPPIPPAPLEPTPFTCVSEDKEMRRLARNEHGRQVKCYQRAVKDRDKTIKDRRKYLEKREKLSTKERDKETQREKKARRKEEAMEAKREASVEKEVEKAAETAISNSDGAMLTPTTSEVDERDTQGKPRKPPRDRKFCLLPNRVSGEIDPCWVRVFMPGVDEVGAHCGLFIMDGSRYEWFVENVSERIVDWVGEIREG
ncbi:MAG: hypothetical protein Q9217_001712 [Psora testacea]